MDCKVIYEFGLSLVKRFAVSIFLYQGREVESEKLFGLDLGLQLRRHCVRAGLEDRFMVNKDIGFC